jgi:geranylgeranyl diphosphate synthase, type II
LKKLTLFQQCISEALDNFCRQNKLQPAELYEPINYILTLGGKRMRPLMTLVACDAFDGQVENAINAAVAIELFHNFSLIHDDIMDKAPVRRNKPTVHEKWNSNIAILSGDAMLVRAYQLIAATPHPYTDQALHVFSNSAIQVCEGQQLDMNYENVKQISIEQYLRMIELKTAVLLAASLKIGAIIGNASSDNAAHIYTFGISAGIAFQLQDDILDVYSDEEKFGKQKGGDIITNKKTYLLIKALELANPSTLKELNSWIYNPLADNATKKVKAVTEIYNLLDVKTLAESELHIHYQSAITALDKINIADSRKELLFAIIQELLHRKH